MKRLLQLIATVSLLVTLVYGWLHTEDKTIEYLASHFEKSLVEKTDSESEAYQVSDSNSVIGYVYPAEITGWGGPMTVAPLVTPKGIVTRVVIPEHRETPSFMDYVLSQNFLAQFEGKSPTDPIELGRDIDAVTGATVSSRAITMAVRQGVNIASEELLGIIIPSPTKKWSFGRNEGLLLLLYCTVLVSITFKIRKARLVILVMSFLFLGLMMKFPVSMSNIAALCMGHVPDIHDNLFWWMLVPGSLVIVLLLGKNVYCSWLCPFGSIMEVIARTGGMRLTLPKKIQYWVKTATKGLVVLLFMVAFITGNATNSSVEPFSALFSLKGSTFQWYLVPLAFCGSFLIPRFWCRFLCPAGVCYNGVAGIRGSIRRGILGQSNKKELCGFPRRKKTTA